MKFVEPHPFADPDAAARKLVEIANGVEAVQEGRIYIERVNEPFLAAGGSGERFHAGIERAIALGWIWRHESGTYVRFTDSGGVVYLSSATGSSGPLQSAKHCVAGPFGVREGIERLTDDLDRACARIEWPPRSHDARESRSRSDLQME
jgi:hypothetical protein